MGLFVSLKLIIRVASAAAWLWKIIARGGATLGIGAVAVLMLVKQIISHRLNSSASTKAVYPLVLIVLLRLLLQFQPNLVQQPQLGYVVNFPLWRMGMGSRLLPLPKAAYG